MSPANEAAMVRLLSDLKVNTAEELATLADCVCEKAVADPFYRGMYVRVVLKLITAYPKLHEQAGGLRLRFPWRTKPRGPKFGENLDNRRFCNLGKLEKN